MLIASLENMGLAAPGRHEKWYRMVNSTLDIMGQHSALQTAFDIHTTGHGHALSVSGLPMLVDLEAMKKAEKG